MDSFDITGESHLETVIDLAEQVVVEVTGRFRQRRRYAYENGSFQVLKAFLLRLTDSIQEENTEDKQTAADLVEDCDLEDSRYRGVVKADTKICIIVATGGQITSPALSSAGIHAMMLILGNARQEEPFFPQYRIREPTFFTMGKVFSLLWDEKIDQDSKRITALERSTLPLSDWSSGSASMGFLSLKRYFIVLREGLRYCTALPIMTYDGEGVAAERCIKSDHAIAFTGPAPPNLRGNEHPRPGEHPIRPLPIRIVAIEDHELSPAARIDFATVYTIHHEVKVRPIGAADYGSIKALHQQFDSVWASKSLSSGERVLINNDRSYAKTIEATKKAQIKGKQAQRPSSSKHNNIPEHAAKAAFPQDAKNKQTLNHEANPQNSSMFGPLYPATPLTDNQRHDDHEETENSIMTKAQACLDGFNQVVDHLEIFDKASAQDDRPRRLTEGVKPGLQSMDEWCDERARFKLAINDLRNVIDGDRFSTGDEHALRVTNGLLNDLRELERNLNQVLDLIKGKRVRFRTGTKPGLEWLRGVQGPAFKYRKYPDELLPVRLQSTADMIDDLFRSTKLLRRYQNRNATTAQPVGAAETTFLSPRAEPSSPIPDVHSEDDWRESLWALDDSESEGSSEDDVESCADK